MVNNSNSKIYIIHPTIEYDEGDVYVGSTTKEYLSQRMQQHRTEYKRFKYGNPNGYFTVFGLFEKYGINNCDIFLVENVNANSKNELHAREGLHIRNIKCVNKLISGGKTREEELERKNDTMNPIKKIFDYTLSPVKKSVIANAVVVIH